jgi:hypothetical protein
MTSGCSLLIWRAVLNQLNGLKRSSLNEELAVPDPLRGSVEELAPVSHRG